MQLVSVKRRFTAVCKKLDAARPNKKYAHTCAQCSSPVYTLGAFVLVAQEGLYKPEKGVLLGARRR